MERVIDISRRDRVTHGVAKARPAADGKDD
jgi:hypothetical protein